MYMVSKHSELTLRRLQAEVTGLQTNATLPFGWGNRATFLIAMIYFSPLLTPAALVLFAPHI